MRSKPIYKTYVSKDKMIHTEAYPIIYENSEYIYYKECNTKQLQYITKESVYKSFDDFVKYCINHHRLWPNPNPILSIDVYTLENPNFSKEEIELLLKKNKEDEIKKEIKHAEENIAYYTRIRDNYVEKLNNLKESKSSND